MALATIPGAPIMYPSLHGDTNALAFQARTIDADGEKVAFIIRCPQAGTLNRVGFQLGTVTQAPSSLRASFQNVDASGDPDGTQDQFRDVAQGSLTSDTWIATGLITSDGTDGGTKRTVVQGEVLAVVLEIPSFTLGDDIDISAYTIGAMGMSGAGAPHNALLTASWAHNQSGLLAFALQYSDNTWVPLSGCMPITSVASTAYQSGSTPDEKGMKFTMPFGARAIGVAMHGNLAAGSEGKFHLYDANDTELAAADVDTDEFDNGQGLYFFEFDTTSVELSTSTVYRVTLEATAAVNVTLNEFTPDSSTYASAMFWGENAVQTSRADAGSWTDATDGSNLCIGLLLDQIEDGLGGGGTVIIKRNYDD